MWGKEVYDNPLDLIQLNFAVNLKPLLKIEPRGFPGVRWLRRHAPGGEGLGPIPGQGTRSHPALSVLGAQMKIPPAAGKMGGPERRGRPGADDRGDIFPELKNKA